MTDRMTTIDRASGPAIRQCHGHTRLSEFACLPIDKRPEVVCTSACPAHQWRPHLRHVSVHCKRACGCKHKHHSCLNCGRAHTYEAQHEMAPLDTAPWRSSVPLESADCQHLSQADSSAASRYADPKGSQAEFLAAAFACKKGQICAFHLVLSPGQKRSGLESPWH